MRKLICLFVLVALLASVLPFPRPVHAAQLTIQPSGKDTYLHQNSPNFNDGALITLYVRSYHLSYDKRSVLQFSLSGLPSGAIITSATLSLYYWKSSTLDPVGRTYWAYRLTRTDWVEAQATWNIYKTGSAWTAAGGDYTTTDGASLAVPASFGWMNWNVLAQVQYAQTNTIEAAFLIRDGTESSGYNYESDFYSNNYTTDTTLRPKLVIEYGVVPTVTTSVATNVACETATLNGNITGTGGVTPTDYGFVWDTVSRADPGSATAPTASLYAGKWEKGTGSYPIGSYSHDIDTSKGYTYYFRFAAYNTVGWAYGSEVTFTCWKDPVIITQDVTDITVSTARLQSYISDGGGTTCQVRFGWGTNEAGDNITAYNGTGSPSAFEGSYTTGASPYLDISDLAKNEDYWFNVEVINACGTASTGTSKTFKTGTSVGSPSNVIAIPSYNSIILSWVKGAGAPNTFIRFRINACPAHATPPVDGTLIYPGTGSTYTHANLVSGTDYCYYVRGFDTTEGYSNNYTVIHATTLAAGTILGAAGEAVGKPSGLTGQPDISSALEDNIPFFQYTKSSSTSTGIPHANFVYILVLIVLAGLSYAVYKWTHSIETIVVIWIFVNWVCYPTLHIPVIVPLFVSLVGVGYGIYRMRSVV